MHINQSAPVGTTAAPERYGVVDSVDCQDSCDPGDHGVYQLSDDGEVEVNVGDHGVYQVLDSEEAASSKLGDCVDDDFEHLKS